MKLSHTLPLVSGLAATAAAASSDNSTTGPLGNSTSACVGHPIPSDLDGASAWGVFGKLPAIGSTDLQVGRGDYAYYNWAFAAFSNGFWNTTLVAPPGVPLPNSTSRWHICDMMVSDMLANTIERGQNDNGTCLQTLDSNCIQSIRQTVTDAYNSYVQASQSWKNFSPTTACNLMQQAIQMETNNATTCATYLRNSSVTGGLVNPPDSVGACETTSNKVIPGGTFAPAMRGDQGEPSLGRAGIFPGPLNGDGHLEAAYNQSFRNVVAKVAWYIPRNISNDSTLGVPSAVLAPWIGCLRANMTADGAVVPSSLPASGDAALHAPRAAVIMSGIVVALLSVFTFAGVLFV